MEPTYFIGQILTLGSDYVKLCDAPKGTKLYTPAGEIVTRDYPGTITFYGNVNGNHYYSPTGQYVVIGLGEDKVGELAKELWGVRNEALAGTYMVSEDFVTPDHEKTYRALADYVLAREAAQL